MRFCKVALVVALAAGTFACRGAGIRPTKERQPLQADFDRCFNAARTLGNNSLQGQMTLKLYVEADGAVSFAYINDEKGLDSKQLNHCITDFIVLTKYPGEGLDFLRPYGKVSFSRESASVQLPDPRDIPKEPIDVALAKETLEFADWADGAARGWAYYYTQQYPESIAAFRGFLQKTPDDVRALRGLASALAASGGDLKEAKETAAKAIQLKPDTEATHEAMLRVCIAAKDDNCIFDEFDKARKSADVQVRSIELATLQDQAKAAAERLQAGEHQQHEQQQEEAKKQQEEQLKKADPLSCHTKPEGDARTLCGVETCFDAGGKAYAQSLKGLTGQDYKPGKWKFKNGKATLPIRAEGGQDHDASWEVKVGDNASLSLKPLDIDANNITKEHNACGK